VNLTGNLFVRFAGRNFNLFMRERLLQAFEEPAVEIIRARPINCVHKSLAFRWI